jgi:hypothetical protein
MRTLGRLLPPPAVRIGIYLIALIAGIRRIAAGRPVMEGWLGVVIAFAALLALATIAYRLAMRGAQHAPDE